MTAAHGSITAGTHTDNVNLPFVWEVIIIKWSVDVANEIEWNKKNYYLISGTRSSRCPWLLSTRTYQIFFNLKLSFQLASLKWCQPQISPQHPVESSRYHYNHNLQSDDNHHKDLNAWCRLDRAHFGNATHQWTRHHRKKDRSSANGVNHGLRWIWNHHRGESTNLFILFSWFLVNERRQPAKNKN